ncbi:MAG: hypothetical protein M3R63_01820 [Actinomycetota bacterium]|nr:hypothetical protein [Actinomycetota bacterium]
MAYPEPVAYSLAGAGAPRSVIVASRGLANRLGRRTSRLSSSTSEFIYEVITRGRGRRSSRRQDCSPVWQPPSVGAQFRPWQLTARESLDAA